MNYIVWTRQVTKYFHGREVLADVNMHVKKGEIYGFLGPNGAGKTTVMKMLTNLIKPTTGEIEIFGEKLTPSSYEYLKRVGSLIEYPAFYEKLSAMENLKLHCEYMGYHNEKAIREALDLVKLHAVGDQPVKQFSLGMKQRLGIARAITTRPELLILDEPINGLDPSGIKELRQLFRMLSKEFGVTLIISSHILSEIEQMADTIGVIHNGKLIEEVPMGSIRNKQTEYIELATNDCTTAAFILENDLGLQNFKVIDDRLIRIYDSGVSQNDISRALINHNVAIEGISKKSKSLEEFFMNLTGGGGKSA